MTEQAEEKKETTESKRVFTHPLIRVSSINNVKNKLVCAGLRNPFK